MKQQDSQFKKAIAGGEQNNCLFNCIAHSLFSLDKDKLEQIFKRPIFGKIIENFKNYHDIDKDLFLEDLLAIHEHFDSPYDIEVIWGPVLRKSALDLPALEERDKEDILLGRNVSGDVGSMLSNALGASFVLHSANDEEGVFCLNTPVQDEIFKIEPCHSENGGGHFDFYYPNDLNGELALKHNNSYEYINVESIFEDGIKVTEYIKAPIFSYIYNECKYVDDTETRKAVVNGLLLDFVTTSLERNKTITIQHDSSILGKRTRTEYEESNHNKPEDVDEPPASKRGCIIS